MYAFYAILEIFNTICFYAIFMLMLLFITTIKRWGARSNSSQLGGQSHEKIYCMSSILKEENYSIYCNNGSAMFYDLFKIHVTKNCAVISFWARYFIFSKCVCFVHSLGQVNWFCVRFNHQTDFFVDLSSQFWRKVVKRNSFKLSNIEWSIFVVWVNLILPDWWYHLV